MPDDLDTVRAERDAACLLARRQAQRIASLTTDLNEQLGAAIRKAMGRAWDEGYATGQTDPVCEAENPYRKVQS